MRPGPRPSLDRDLLARLREAITTCRIVEVRYLSQSTGRHSRQSIAPYGLLYGNRPFLVGRTDWSDAMRLWRLGNMSEAQVTGETFTRDPDFNLEAYARRSFGTFQEKPVDVMLRFTAEVKRDAAALLFHPSQSMEENADGTLTVRFTAGGLDEMCWHPRNLGRQRHGRATGTLAPSPRRHVRGPCSASWGIMIMSPLALIDHPKKRELHGISAISC